jgi:predicted transcriptional regulator of viral defense system
MGDKITKTLSERETRLLTTLSAAGKQIFATQDARDVLGSSINVNQVLSRLRHKRWLKRLSKGLYLILPFEAGMDGDFTVSSLLIATYLVQPSVIAYGSALNHHGFIEQISHTTFVATTQKKKKVEIKDLGLRFKFVTLPPAKMFGQETLWIEGKEEMVAEKLRALLRRRRARDVYDLCRAARHAAHLALLCRGGAGARHTLGRNAGSLSRRAVVR